MTGSRESRRISPHAALFAGLALAWPGTVAATQERPVVVAQAERLDTLKQRDGELQAAREAQRKSAETEAALADQDARIADAQIDVFRALAGGWS